MQMIRTIFCESCSKMPKEPHQVAAEDINVFQLKVYYGLALDCYSLPPG